MEVREIRVEFKKTVSDGNYGNETHTVGYTVALTEPGDRELDKEEVATVFSALARAVVLAQLKASENEGVRSALETHEERQARWKREQDEYRARYPFKQAPSDEPLAGSGELPVEAEDDPF